MRIELEAHELEFDPKAYGRWRKTGADMHDPATGLRIEFGLDSANKAALFRIAMRDGATYYVNLVHMAQAIADEHKKRGL